MLITLAHLSSVAHNQETFDLLAVKALQNFLKTVTSTWTHLRAITLGKKNLSKYVKKFDYIFFPVTVTETEIVVEKTGRPPTLLM